MNDRIKIVVILAVFLLFSVLQCLTGVRKNKRVRQALLVPFSVIISAVLVFMADSHFEKLIELIERIETITSSTAVNEAAAADTVAMNQIGRFFLLDSEVALANLIILAAFILLKGIICIFLSKLAGNRKYLKITSCGFYYFDDTDYNDWFLKNKWANFRNYMKAAVIAVNSVVGVWLGLTWYLGRESDVWLVAFPVSTVIIINEIFSFVNGKTKEDLEFEVIGENTSVSKISYFNRLGDVIKNTLPEPLLFHQIGCEFVNRESTLKEIENLLESEDSSDISIGKYFQSSERSKKIGMDEYKATVELVRGKNVVFFNPFYRDLSVCLTLPIVNSLLKGRKCLVVTGRSAISEDVKLWLEEIIADFSKMETLWRISELDEDGHQCEVGILNFPKLYDNRLMNANQKFFEETDFVLFLEPSIIVSTAQIAISILTNSLCADGKKPVYCICDHNTSGLVDTMSHVLQTEITTVVAPPVPRCMYTCMCWDATGEFKRQSLFDKQTKYLGNGVELAAIAVKNQIPEVNWYCESKAPVRDISWIAGKYYAAICKFMNIPSQQNSLYEKLKFISNPWLAPKKKENFLIAEDEFCNMFNSLRMYLSRGESQSFVNIISENYLLRDYMRCNKQMFVTNPDAIPTIVSDYAKTERNILFKLLIEMSFRQVSEKEILDEFRLIGIFETDVMEILTAMLVKYTDVDNSVFSVECRQIDTDELATVTTSFYSIDINVFEEHFSKSLKTAFFILEEEHVENSFVDARLFGQVTQLLLPGQYITYDGKYYRTKTISPVGGVVLRRASDLYDGRKYYRQTRKYNVSRISEDSLQKMVTINDIEMAFISADFEVNTEGYLEMDDIKNLKGAKTISFSGDPNIDFYSRHYKNKTMIRIKFPRDPEEENEDPENSRNILFTLCMLLQELFRTVFPTTWQYLAVGTKVSDKIGGILNHIIYPIKGDVEDGYIYIIEDCDMDLGLLEAFERNFDGFMSIIADFLDWHFEKLKEPESKDPLPQEVVIKKRERREKQSSFVRFVRRIRRLFRIEREDEVDLSETDVTEIDIAAHAEDHTAEALVEEELNTVPDDESRFESINTKADDDDSVNEENTDGDEIFGISEDTRRRTIAMDDYIPGLDDDPLITDPDGTDIFEESIINTDPDLKERLDYLFNQEISTKYKEDCFLKFGFDEIDPRIKVKDVRDYLRVRGWCNNEFTKARKPDVIPPEQLVLNSDSHCDFCLSPLTGVSYEKINDGRIRCNECSASAIDSVDEFRELFYQLMEMMQSFYDIRMRVPVSIVVTDIETIRNGKKHLFKESRNSQYIKVGYAKRTKDMYSIEIESGCPRLVAIETIIHELTHIWQKTNWSDSRINSRYGLGNRNMIYEGMANWTAIQFLYMIGEAYYATKREQYLLQRQDSEGEGFRNYCLRYPFVKDSSYVVRSPFMVEFPF